MLNREEVLKLKEYTYKLQTYKITNNRILILQLCNYWLEYNPEKKIEKLDNLDNLSLEKLNEIIDALNEMREGK